MQSLISGEYKKQRVRNASHMLIRGDPLLACNACTRAALAVLVSSRNCSTALAASASFRRSNAICRQAVHEAGCLQVHDQILAVFTEQSVLRSKMCAGPIRLNQYSSLCIYHDTIGTYPHSGEPHVARCSAQLEYLLSHPLQAS